MIEVEASMLKWVVDKLNLVRDGDPPVASISTHGGAGGWYSPLTADSLLSLGNRKRSLQQLWDNSPFSRPVFDAFWLTPVRELAVRLQQLPAAQSGPYAREGGMLDEALDVALCAVRLSRGWMLPPGAAPEEQAAQGAAWCTAIFWVALLHDMNALNAMAAFYEDGTRWYPGITVPSAPWRLRFTPDDQECAGRAALVAFRLLPEEGLRWLARWPGVVDMLLVYLSGNKPAGKILHAAVNEARQKCGLLAPELVLSPPLAPVETADAIPQNAAGSFPEHAQPNLTQSPVATFSTSYTHSYSQTPDPDLTAPALVSAIEHNAQMADGKSESDTAPETGCTPGELLNILDQLTVNEDGRLPGSVSTPETAARGVLSDDAQCIESEAVGALSPGERFWHWLIASVTNGTLAVNAQDSLLHVMLQYVFVQSPECFYRYLVAEPQVAGGKNDVQKNFEALNHHYSRNGKGIYIYRKYENQQREGRFTKISGYMIPLTLIYTNGILPHDSLWLSPNK